MLTVDLGESTEGASAWRPSVRGHPRCPVPAADDQRPPGRDRRHRVQDGESRREGDSSLHRAGRGLRTGSGPLVAENGRVVGFAVPEAGSGPAGLARPARRRRRDPRGAERGRDHAAPGTGGHHRFERASHAFKNGGFAAAIPNSRTPSRTLPRSRPGRRQPGRGPAERRRRDPRQYRPRGGFGGHRTGTKPLDRCGATSPCASRRGPGQRRGCPAMTA